MPSNDRQAIHSAKANDLSQDLRNPGIVETRSSVTLQRKTMARKTDAGLEITIMVPTEVG